MSASDELVKYTKLLGLINGLLPVGVELGVTLVQMVKDGIAQGKGDEKTVEEAQAALDGFKAATADAKEFIQDWLDTHPPEAEDGEEDNVP